MTWQYTWRSRSETVGPRELSHSGQAKLTLDRDEFSPSHGLILGAVQRISGAGAPEISGAGAISESLLAPRPPPFPHSFAEMGEGGVIFS